MPSVWVPPEGCADLSPDMDYPLSENELRAMFWEYMREDCDLTPEAFAAFKQDASAVLNEWEIWLWGKQLENDFITLWQLRNYSPWEREVTGGEPAGAG